MLPMFSSVSYVVSNKVLVVYYIGQSGTKLRNPHALAGGGGFHAGLRRSGVFRRVGRPARLIEQCVGTGVTVDAAVGVRWRTRTELTGNRVRAQQWTTIWGARPGPIAPATMPATVEAGSQM